MAWWQIVIIIIVIGAVAGYVIDKWRGKL